MVDLPSDPPQPEERGLITSDPKVRSGSPVVRGTRISVEELVSLAATGATPAQVAEEFGLEPEDVRAALLYAARVASGEPDLEQ